MFSWLTCEATAGNLFVTEVRGCLHIAIHFTLHHHKVVFDKF